MFLIPILPSFHSDWQPVVAPGIGERGGEVWPRRKVRRNSPCEITSGLLLSSAKKRDKRADSGKKRLTLNLFIWAARPTGSCTIDARSVYDGTETSERWTPGARKTLSGDPNLSPPAMRQTGRRADVSRSARVGEHACRLVQERTGQAWGSQEGNRDPSAGQVWH